MATGNKSQGGGWGSSILSAAGKVLGGLLFFRRKRNPNSAAHALYRDIIQTFRDNYADWRQVAQCKTWLHQFDDSISSDADAVKYANLLLKELDTYSLVRSPAQVAKHAESHKPSSADIGIKLRFADGRYVVQAVAKGSTAAAGGIKAGDFLLKAGGKVTEELCGEQLQSLLSGHFGKVIDLTIQSGEHQPRAVQLHCKSLDKPTVVARMQDGGVGYIHLNTFYQSDAVLQLQHFVQRGLSLCKSFVLDLRQNTGGLIDLAIDAACLFVQEGHLVTIDTRTSGRDWYERKVIRATADAVVTEITGPGKAPSIFTRPRLPCLTTKLPLIVLINEQTMSASELLTGALKDNKRALVCGMPSKGKGIGQHRFAMARGHELQVSTLYYLTPSGWWPGNGAQNCRPLVPDIEIAPGKGFRIFTARDNQIQEAVALAKQQTPGVLPAQRQEP